MCTFSYFFRVVIYVFGLMMYIRVLIFLAAFVNLHIAHLCEKVWEDERDFTIRGVHDEYWGFRRLFDHLTSAAAEN